MWQVGLGELLVIAMVALCVVPTQEWPKIARTAGRLWARLMRMRGELSRLWSESS